MKSPSRISRTCLTVIKVRKGNVQNRGLGLALYISAEINKGHGAEIGIDSEVGEGSVFWFTLPDVMK